MSVLKPRNRLVNFRVSEEEFRHLREATLTGGARSISDYARCAVLGRAAPPPHTVRIDEGVIGFRLASLDRKIADLEAILRQVASELPATRADSAKAVSG